MITKNSWVYVSTDKFINEATIDELEKIIGNGKKTYAMSFHNGVKVFDYSQINSINKRPLEPNRRIFELIFEDNPGNYLGVICDEYQKVYTCNRGYVNAKDLDKMEDCFVNVEGNYSKLLHKDIVIRPKGDFVNVDVMYNKSYFCNGILVRSE